MMTVMTMMTMRRRRRRRMRMMRMMRMMTTMMNIIFEEPINHLTSWIFRIFSESSAACQAACFPRGLQCHGPVLRQRQVELSLGPRHGRDTAQALGHCQRQQRQRPPRQWPRRCFGLLADALQPRQVGAAHGAADGGAQHSACALRPWSQD